MMTAMTMVKYCLCVIADFQVWDVTTDHNKFSCFNVKSVGG